MIRPVFKLIFVFIAVHTAVFAQGVTWSAFLSGFANSSSVSTTLVSAVGQPFVGSSLAGSTSILSGSLSGNVVSVTGMTENEGIVPHQYALAQNYPNPFNPSTTIRYELPTAGFVSMYIFDILGQLVATVVNEERAAGSHHVIVSLPNLPSGVYLYRMHARDYVSTKKFILLK